MSTHNLKLASLVVSASLIFGCAGESESQSNQGGSSSQTQVEQTFNFTQMMANYADNIIVPAYQTAQTQSRTLTGTEGTMRAYCNAIGTDQETAAKAFAQTSWHNTMQAWQQTELSILGPAAENENAKRNAVLSYASSFPTSSCAIDQAVVLAQDTRFDITDRAFNARGLSALEYILFNDNLDHTCPVQIQQTSEWNNLDDTARKQQRCQYGALLAQDITQNIGRIITDWSIDGGDYRATFVNPVNTPDNLSALSDALFYIELETKDEKIGLPSGISVDCAQKTCPSGIESPYSETSFQHVRDNLTAFKTSFNGKNGLGFDDIIIARGFASTAQQMNDDIDNAIAYIDTLNTSLRSQSLDFNENGSIEACENSQANPDTVRTVPMCSLYGYLKRISDALRIDFVTIVNLDLPSRGQSDND